MNQITCDTILDLLPLYIDQVCSTDSNALVEGHLRVCPACKAEYEKLSQREFLFDSKERAMLTGLSKRWKKSKRATLWKGISIVLVIVLLVGFFFYGYSEKAVPAGEITVSSLSRLENGDLAFVLEAADGSGIREVSHYEVDATVYITATTTRIPFFSSSNNSASGWIFNTQDTGIKRICYVEQNGVTSTELRIWDAEEPVADADAKTQAQIRNMENLEDCGSDALVKEIYLQKVQYIGSAPDDMRLLGVMRIGEMLGPYTIQLTTSSEPYGITLHFKDPVAPAECGSFDEKMRAYASVILAMIDNSGSVRWTYPSYDQDGKGIEVARKFNLDDARSAVGADIKNFSKGEAALRELCDILGLY